MYSINFPRRIFLLLAIPKWGLIYKNFVINIAAIYCEEGSRMLFPSLHKHPQHYTVSEPTRPHV